METRSHRRDRTIRLADATDEHAGSERRAGGQNRPARNSGLSTAIKTR
jgi:hypothetical protein